METEKRNFELSFDDFVLLKLGLHELRRIYESYKYLDSEERIAEINELDCAFCFYNNSVL